LNFCLLDYSARSCREYEYRNVIVSNTNYIGPAVAVTTRFDGVLIASKKKCYISLLNPEYTLQRDFNVAYVKPYNRKYPHAIHNGLANSNKGTVKGIFNPISPDCMIEMKYADYADDFIDFLSDGTPKLIKTFDGHAWYAEIDTPVKREYDKVIGIVNISFSWTEVAEVPSNFCKMVTG